MKSVDQLVNNIVGQLNGINKMIDEKKDCYSVLNQMKAVKSATSSLMDKYIEDNFGKCISNPSDGKNKETIKKLITEITKK